MSRTIYLVCTLVVSSQLDMSLCPVKSMDAISNNAYTTFLQREVQYCNVCG